MIFNQNYESLLRICTIFRLMIYFVLKKPIFILLQLETNLEWIREKYWKKLTKLFSISYVHFHLFIGENFKFSSNHAIEFQLLKVKKCFQPPNFFKTSVWFQFHGTFRFKIFQRALHKFQMGNFKAKQYAPRSLPDFRKRVGTKFFPHCCCQVFGSRCVNAWS